MLLIYVWNYCRSWTISPPSALTASLIWIPSEPRSVSNCGLIAVNAVVTYEVTVVTVDWIALAAAVKPASVFPAGFYAQVVNICTKFGT